MTLSALFLVACLLLLMQLMTAAILQVLATDGGFLKGLGPRDTPLESSVTAGRAQRASHNMLETFPVFVGLICLNAMLDATNAQAILGATLYVVARLAFFLIYLFVTVPMVRTLAWVTGTVGLFVMAAALL